MIFETELISNIYYKIKYKIDRGHRVLFRVSNVC